MPAKAGDTKSGYDEADPNADLVATEVADLLITEPTKVSKEDSKAPNNEGGDADESSNVGEEVSEQEEKDGEARGGDEQEAAAKGEEGQEEGEVEEDEGTEGDDGEGGLAAQLAEMQAQNKALLSLLNQPQEAVIEAAPQGQAQFTLPDIPSAVYEAFKYGDDDEAGRKALSKYIVDVVQLARQHTLSEVGNITIGIADIRESVRNFFRRPEYRVLRPLQEVVRKQAIELETKHPDKAVVELLEMAADKVLLAAGLKKGKALAKELPEGRGGRRQSSKARLAPGTAARKGGFTKENKPTGQQAEVTELISHHNSFMLGD